MDNDGPEFLSGLIDQLVILYERIGNAIIALTQVELALKQ